MLARRQAERVGNKLGQLNPHVEVEYHWLESQADRLGDDKPLHQFGGKGLFVREIERALLDGDADVAVHSLKDLPCDETTQGLTIAAVPRRHDVRDCLIAHDGAATIDDLPNGAVVGTSSHRRGAQLQRLREDLKIQTLRGNIETRLAKVLEDNVCDATLLAVAGLARAGMADAAACPIDTDQVMPAAGQGALAIQCRGDDHVTVRRCLPLNDSVSAAAAHAERLIVGGLGGDCHSAMGVLAEPIGEGGVDGMRICCRVLAGDGSQCIETNHQVVLKHLAKATNRIVAELIDLGARDLLTGDVPTTAMGRSAAVS